MMGAAAAVARGNLPLEFVAASLCAPARAVLPLAPPQVSPQIHTQHRSFVVLHSTSDVVLGKTCSFK